MISRQFWHRLRRPFPARRSADARHLPTIGGFGMHALELVEEVSRISTRRAHYAVSIAAGR